jgi:3-methyladenine DNA glycosylase AlkD
MSALIEKYLEQISSEIGGQQNPDKAKWLENYVKHDVRSLGVGIPQIRQTIKSTEKKFQLEQLPPEAQAEMLHGLMRQEYTDFKLAAILYLQLYGNHWPTKQKLTLISEWFDKEWIRDWNVCDWLCVRILSPLLDGDPGVCIKVFKAWNHSHYLWKARASLVPFAQSKTLIQHHEIVKALSATLIQREERFCKTAVGWVLREFSRHDPDFVLTFLDQYSEWSTPEVLRNAKKYLS